MLVAILALGAVVRGAYLQDLAKDPLYLKPALDAELHDYWARGLATGDWALPRGRTDPEIRTTPYFRPPGYPYVLSAIYRVTGGAPAATRVAQFSLGLLSAMIGFALARRYAGDAAGLVAAALMATSWNLIFFEGELLDACLLAGLTPLVLLAMRFAGDRGGSIAPFLAGASIGAFALIRPNVLAFVPAAAVWLVWVRRRRVASRRAWPAAAILVLGTLLAVLPATVRNRLVSGEWIAISANGGINLLIGNNPEADGVRAGIPHVETLAGIGGWTCFDYPLVVEGLARQVGRHLSYGEASRIWTEQALQWIGSHPRRFIALTAKRAALLFGPVEAGDRDLEMTRRASPVLRRIPGRFPAFCALAILGVVFLFLEARGQRGVSGPADGARRDRLETATLLGLFVAAYAMSLVPFFFNARYRVPILVVSFIFCADALVRLASLVRERRWRHVALATAFAAGVGLLASVNWAGYHADPGEWHTQRANAFRDAQRASDAVREYEEAIRLSPRAVVPRRDLALVLRDQGRAGEAARLLESSLVIDPHAFEARFDLAQLLAAQGRFAAAAEEYAKVIADAPRHANAHLSLGTALLQLGRDAEAMEQYREAEGLAPKDPLVAFVYGRALVGSGRTEEGVERLRRSLQLAPDFEPARRALSTALASRPHSGSRP